MIDRFAQLLDIDKTGAPQGLAAQNAKPALHLVEPRSVGWGKMKMDVRMALEPTVVLGLVGIEIVEDDVDFISVAVAIDNPIHEI